MIPKLDVLGGGKGEWVISIRRIVSRDKTQNLYIPLKKTGGPKEEGYISKVVKYKSHKMARSFGEEEVVDLGQDLTVMLFEQLEPSSFRTYNYSRFHQSKAIVWVEIGGCRKKFVFNS